MERVSQLPRVCNPVKAEKNTVVEQAKLINISRSESSETIIAGTSVQKGQAVLVQQPIGVDSIKVLTESECLKKSIVKIESPTVGARTKWDAVKLFCKKCIQKAESVLLEVSNTLETWATKCHQLDKKVDNAIKFDVTRKSFTGRLKEVGKAIAKFVVNSATGLLKAPVRLTCQSLRIGLNILNLPMKYIKISRSLSEKYPHASGIKKLGYMFLTLAKSLVSQGTDMFVQCAKLALYIPVDFGLSALVLGGIAIGGRVVEWGIGKCCASLQMHMQKQERRSVETQKTTGKDLELIIDGIMYARDCAEEIGVSVVDTKFNDSKILATEVATVSLGQMALNAFIGIIA